MYSIFKYFFVTLHQQYDTHLVTFMSVVSREIETCPYCTSNVTCGSREVNKAGLILSNYGT